MFGGESSQGLLGDTWIYEWKMDIIDTDSGQWIHVPVSGPKARHYHALSSLGDKSGRVLLFGGSTTQSSDLAKIAERFEDDTWIFTPTSIEKDSLIEGTGRF